MPLTAGVTAAASVLAAGTALGWDFFPPAGAVAPSGTQKGTRAVVIHTTTSALEQDTVSGQTLKLLLRRSLTDFSVTFVFCNSFS